MDEKEARQRLVDESRKLVGVRYENGSGFVANPQAAPSSLSCSQFVGIVFGRVFPQTDLKSVLLPKGDPGGSYAHAIWFGLERLEASEPCRVCRGDLAVYTSPGPFAFDEHGVPRAWHVMIVTSAVLGVVGACPVERRVLRDTKAGYERRIEDAGWTFKTYLKCPLEAAGVAGLPVRCG